MQAVSSQAVEVDAKLVPLRVALGSDGREWAFVRDREKLTITRAASIWPPGSWGGQKAAEEMNGLETFRTTERLSDWESSYLSSKELIY